MTDPRALVRVVSELVWALRRDGFEVAPSQSIDLARAFVLLGFDRPEALRDAVAGLVGAPHARRAELDAAFGRFFDPSSRLDLDARLERGGASPEERALVRDWLAGDEGEPPLGALLEGRGDLARWLSTRDARVLLDAAESPLREGVVAHRLMARLGVTRAPSELERLRATLAGAFGPERADALVDALRGELARTLAELREQVRQRSRVRPPAGGPLDAPFDALSEGELAEVRLAVRALVERLRGRAEVRRRRARRGRLDVSRTVRRAHATQGVPIRPALKARRIARPRLVVLCDISESVRVASRLLLELTYLAQGVLADARTFVFVSELGETTALFARKPASAALADAYGGKVVPTGSNSNYGRVLHQLAERHPSLVDRRTTLLVLGDGRTNYLDPGVEALARVTARARAVYWLCPEPRSEWARGDSAMERYARACTRVLPAATARELLVAARVALR